jgi:ABC-type dipeptide/oligopeptide/nickel transport system ATPase component
MFAPAFKAQRKARIALIGVSGAGKTYSALQLAAGLSQSPQSTGKIALIDTENASAALYSDIVPFDVCVLKRHAPAEYVKAIKFAADHGYEVLVIDSLSHAWTGRGGAIEMVDQAAARTKSGSSFEAWRKVTPEHNALVAAMCEAPLHIIVTMRSKMEHVVEKDDRGKTRIVKKGMQPVQREGLEYEFDIVADMEEATMSIGKSRMLELNEDGGVYVKPDRSLGERILQWLSQSQSPQPEGKPEPKAGPKPEPKAGPKPEPKPEPKTEPKPEPKSKDEETAQAFRALASDFIMGLKERGLEDAHERLLKRYVEIVSSQYPQRKAGEVKDFDALTTAYSELWVSIPSSSSSGEQEDDPYREQDLDSYHPHPSA